ncbi:hypothetical protein [uncultured Enterovirga sp.]|uniref:hypothetical protein n=1 Tax=uncultured Enterovirga sp. TaxID=2026352 RepID=UPI0035CA05AD
MITDRRFILAGAAFIAAASPGFAQSPPARAMPNMSPADVKMANQFYSAVIPRAEMSLSTSRVGVELATNRNAHEFAGFELAEAITVNMVLKDILTSVPPMDKSAEMALVEKMKGTAKGAAFDRAYIAFQLENHEYLRDLADAYLANSAGATDPAEKQGRHLGALMLGVFKEHVAICKRISAELKA